MPNDGSIAYFTLEIALEQGMPTYSGGLGILAGDTIRAGKAYPQDNPGKDLIRGIFQAKEALKPDIRVVYLENYDMGLARLLAGAVVIRLNTPQPDRRSKSNRIRNQSPGNFMTIAQSSRLIFNSRLFGFRAICHASPEPAAIANA